ncbi:hypothetical protein BGZ57DRAFT_857273 [Hyaloscypha finlandica]|nr:hypothetical protein BGZ57DRAFT_857273 [Hyaloscypha finlandica]
MHLTLSRALLSSLAFGQCYAAVTWRTVGCDGWTHDGKNIDQIWDNAQALVTNAQARIDAIPDGNSVFDEPARRAGGNAKFMFGINFNRFTGIDQAGKVVMASARVPSTNSGNVIKSNTAGALFDMSNAFLFCGANTWTRGTWDNNPLMQDVWYAKIQTGAITEYLVPNVYSPAGTPRPCTEKDEKGKPLYVAKTFATTQVIDNGVEGQAPVSTEFIGIILCSTELVKAVLEPGFAATDPTPEKPSPDKYISLSGTLVHEMVHVVGRSRNTNYDDGQPPRYGFNLCTDLANTDQNKALIMPDNYRIFAEMSMSPATKWFPTEVEKTT